MRAICNAGWREIVRRSARLTRWLRMLAALLGIERVFVLSKACVMALLRIKQVFRALTAYKRATCAMVDVNLCGDRRG